MARWQRAEERLAAKAVKASTKAQTNGCHSELESDHILANNPVTESPSDINGHENGIVAKHLKNGSMPSIKFNESHMVKHHASRDTYSVRSSRHRSTHFLHRLRWHTYNHDSEFLEGFEFDSDIVMPPEVAVPRASSMQTSFTNNLDSKTTDPWNAVCVVGLHVYLKDEMLSVEVVHPVPEEEAEAALDIDDPALKRDI
jgi:hypothetical protein